MRAPGGNPDGGAHRAERKSGSHTRQAKSEPAQDHSCGCGPCPADLHDERDLWPPRRNAWEICKVVDEDTRGDIEGQKLERNQGGGPISAQDWNEPDRGDEGGQQVSGQDQSDLGRQD